MYRAIEQVLAASTARSTDSQSAWISVSEFLEGQILIDVSALTGGDTIDFTVEVTDLSESATYVLTHTTVTQITGTGKTRVALTNFGGRLRLKWNVTLAGENTTTFSAVFIGKGLY